ncbi:DUF445 domain-containing protein [Martelella alba]|uniref:DUF445 family protein n=1 Tax=Martelella alba TaxID=2590451 RepID=A0ABY2SIC8_9HYPH|nr:DUF445 family protein [Martelella alba]TKI05130.1 DUF445 family protein [Martelella alba]
MTRQQALRQSKRRALALLCGAAAVFVISLFCAPGYWRDGIKAVAEAAMVGAMADWFAIAALFRRIPVPFIGSHTAVIPRNQDKIADNLAKFVEEKFLNNASIDALLKKQNSADIIADWLSRPANGNTIGEAARQLAQGFLTLAQDSPMQELFRRVLHALLDRLDLARLTANVLTALTRDGRHQALLDVAIVAVSRQLNKPSVRLAIAEQLKLWLKTKHPRKEKWLPSAWLGEQGAELVSDALKSLLDEIEGDSGHAVRRRFDHLARRLIHWLDSRDPALGKVNDIKTYLRSDPAFNAYAGHLWDELICWLRDDLSHARPLIFDKAAGAGLWLGQMLKGDEQLQRSLNRHLNNAAQRLTPNFAAFLTGHISDTVKSWNTADMSQQVELNIGKDLQYIRINGTLVGGFIGLMLYVISFLPEWLSLLFNS